MCDDRADAPEVWTSAWRRARVAHKCCACRETIPPGHRYRYSSGIWDGRPDSFKHCARCWTIFDRLVDIIQRDSGWYDGVAIRLDLNCGELWRENFDLPEPAELAFLTPDEAQALAVEEER